MKNPSNASKDYNLSFKKDGIYLKASSSFINTQCDTKYTTFLFESYNHVDLFSIKVKVIGDNFYYLTKEVKKNIEFISSKKEYYFAINIDKAIPNALIYINIKYKSNKDISYLDSIDYFTESKTEFKLNNGLPLSPNYDRNGNEYNLTLKLDFISQFNYINFDILLLKTVSNNNLDDFNIEYKYEDKKNSGTTTEKKSKVWIYIVIAIGSVIAIVTIATSIWFCYKKKSKLNSIDENIDVDSNLMPQENQETQEIQKHQEENK